MIAFAIDLLSRLKEPSSWAGLAAILVMFHVTLDPTLLDSIVAVGAAVAGLLAIILKEKTSA